MKNKADTSAIKLSILQKKLVQVDQRFPGFFPELGYKLIDDNAPINSFNAVNKWESRIQSVPWPAHNPDLNPIENVWGL